MPSTVEKALNGTPLAMVARVVDPVMIEAFLAFELTKNVADMVNVDQRLNLQGHQIPMVAKMLMENFKNESLADFSVCFKRGVSGFYGEIYRLDAAVITGWMQKYLEEKYQVIENQLMSEKETFYRVQKPTKIDDVPNPDRNLLAAMETILAGKDVGIDLSKHLTPEELAEVEQAKRKLFPKLEIDNAEENEYQREKLNLPVTSEQRAREILLKAEYAKECRDVRTGKLLEGKPLFEEWIKSKKV